MHDVPRSALVGRAREREAIAGALRALPTQHGAAVREGIPCVTTMTGASAAMRAIAARIEQDPEVRSLQEIHGLERAKQPR